MKLCIEDYIRAIARRYHDNFDAALETAEALGIEVSLRTWEIMLEEWGKMEA